MKARISYIAGVFLASGGDVLCDGLVEGGSKS